MVIEQFLSGLPGEFARQLRMSGKDETIDNCVQYVRNLQSAEKACAPRARHGQDVSAATPDSSSAPVHGYGQVPRHGQRSERRTGGGGGGEAAAICTMLKVQPSRALRP